MTTLIMAAVVMFGGQIDYAWPFMWALGLTAWFFTADRRCLKTPWFWAWLLFYALLLTQSVVRGVLLGGVAYVPDNWIPFSIFGAVSFGNIGNWLLVGAVATKAALDGEGWFETVCRGDYEGSLKWTVRCDYRPHIVGLATGLAVLGCLQYHFGAVGFGWVIPYNKEFFSMFPYVNNAGIFFVLAAGIALTLNRRWWPLIILFIYGSYLTHTRFAYPCFAALLMWRTNNKYVRGALVPLGIMCIRWFWPYMIGVKLPEYHKMWCVLAEFPWFGTGSWGFAAFVPGGVYGVFDVLMFATEYGIVGLSLIILGFIGVFRRFRLEDTMDLAVICVLGHSLIDMPLHHVGILCLVLVTAGRRRQ